MKHKSYALIDLLIIAVYGIGILFLRTNLIIRKYHEDIASFVSCAFFLIFLGGMILGGALHPKYGNPNTIREKIGEWLSNLSFLSFWFFALLLPFWFAVWLD